MKLNTLTVSAQKSFAKKLLMPAPQKHLAKSSEAFFTWLENANEKSVNMPSETWKIKFINCSPVPDPSLGREATAKFEIITPKGQIEDINVHFATYFINDVFEIPGTEENTTERRTVLIEEQKALFRKLGVMKIVEECINKDSFDACLNIRHEDLDWAKKIKRDPLLSLIRQQDNTFIYTHERKIGYR